MFYKPFSSFLVHERYQNQRKVVYKNWSNYIYVIFPRFINNPRARKERDCHDQEIPDSENKKKNIIDGVDDLTNIIWDRKVNKPPYRSYTSCRIYIRKKICIETIKLVFYEFRNLDKT